MIAQLHFFVLAICLLFSLNGSAQLYDNTTSTIYEKLPPFNSKFIEKNKIKQIQGKLFNKKIRKLAPRECARISGFPDNFKIHESKSVCYSQFGNSVVVNVVRLVIEKIFQTKCFNKRTENFLKKAG